MRPPLRHAGAKDRILNERDPHFLLGGEKRGAKSAGYDSNHGERTLVQINRGSQDLGIPAEPAPPQIFAYENHRRRTLVAVLGRKNAPHQWLNIQKCKELGSYDGGVHNGRIAAAGQSELMRDDSRQFAKNMILRPPLFEIQIRTPCLRDSLLLIRLKRSEQLIGIRKRQRLQEHGINDAENSRVGADTQREREYGDGGEARILPQHAQCEAYVLKKSFDEGQAVKFPVGVFELHVASQPDASGSPGFFRGHTSVDVFVREQIEMRLKLVLKILIHLPRREQRASSGSERSNPGEHEFIRAPRCAVRGQ